MPPMRRRLAACALVVCALLVDVDTSGAAYRITAGERAREVARARLPSFDDRRAMRHVRRLAEDIGVRVRATRGERRGARYAATRLRSYGYRVKVGRFSVDGARSRNVVARSPRSRKHVVVIGAHIDTVRRSTGANDNASGVAVVLEIARIFARKQQARWVRFVVFGSKEYGVDGRHHVGSQVYVNRLRARGRRRVAGMVSVDMIADGRPLIVGTAGIGPPVVARTLYRKLKRAGIRVAYRVTCDCSDNGPFERAGIPAAFAWSGSEPNYHSPSDTVANLSRRDLRRTGRAMRRFTRAIDRRLIRRFRRRG